MKTEKFEDNLKRAQEMLKELESGNLTLEESLEKFETGIKALRTCYEILNSLEKRVKLIKDDVGEVKMKDLEPEQKVAEE